MAANIHDSGYKKLFSNRTIFRQLVETFISEAWVKDLDFERSETLDNLNWFRQLALHGKVLPEDYAQLDYIYRTKEEVRTMLATTLEQERKNIYQAGRAEGQVEERRRTLLQFIGWRFQLTAEEQLQLAQQLARVPDLNQLTELTERFLQAATLEEFTAYLRT